jgi:uncharacterized protein
MKYLIWILVILLAIWAFKRSRRVKSDAPKEQPPASTPSTPTNMAVCLHCGIHLPQEEAVTGEKGLYCSSEHRAVAQDRNPL